MAHIDDDDAPATASGEGDESNGDFSAAFAERVTDREADAREPLADEKSSTEQEPASARSEPAQGDEPPAGDNRSDPPASAFDPFAGLTPEQKAHFERLQALERSQRGRVGALTKKLQAAQTAPAAPAPAEGLVPAKEGDEAGASDLEARFKSSVEEYNDVVGPVAEMVEALKAEIATLKASPQREQAVSDADAEVMAQAYDTLAQDHPDYQYIAALPQFQQWAEAKPDSVKGLVNSFDPAEVSLALTLFKAEAGLAGAAGGQSGQLGSTAASDKRQRQLEGSRDTRSRGAPAVAGVPNDFSAAFHARVKATAKT